ncbi:hypothetical protein VMCG_08522 [Cytospora schulzeri]|uniref:Uncharacterized protein n=1 Tax=Cytospora schulzeri TaxID=448051 RepID=A0A423VWH0_9PEZI|nr:hypothetical protein VMCG_08522 [Valsa malicola]
MSCSPLTTVLFFLMKTSFILLLSRDPHPGMKEAELPTGSQYGQQFVRVQVDLDHANGLHLEVNSVAKDLPER